MAKKPDCKNHPTDIDKYDGNLQQLARDIGNLRYDELRKFIGYLENKIANDANHDAESGRGKLASGLAETADRLFQAKMAINEVCKICKPYMK